MLKELGEFTNLVLGMDRDALNFGQMAARAFIVYVAAIVMIRIGDKRFLGKNTAFDVILGIVLGSVISRAITGNAPFFPTLAAGFVLVGLHWLMAVTAFHSNRFGTVIKGSERQLVRDGKILWEKMRKSHISEQDLTEALRRDGRSDLKNVKSAYFERSGDFSFTGEKQVNVAEVKVEDGVQVVRIEIS